MENIGGMQWTVLEEYDGDCRRNTMKSVAVYENVRGMQWRVSEECDKDCRKNAMESVREIQ